MSKKDNGLKTSSLGVEIYPQGKHPRTLRKEGKAISPILKDAFKAWAKEQDKRVKKIIESDPIRAAALFINDINGKSPEDMVILVGLGADSIPAGEDESQAANMGDSPIASGEKKKIADKEKEAKDINQPAKPQSDPIKPENTNANKDGNK